MTMKTTTMVALIALAGAVSAAEITLNPTNVSVNCEGAKIVLLRDGAKWSGGGVELEFAADGRLFLASPQRPVSTIDVMFDLGYAYDEYVRVYRDAWERTCGSSGWYPVVAWNSDHPWYMLVNHDGVTDGIGVAVQPNAFAAWRPRKTGTRLHLDVRAGADGVRLGSRRLEVCRIVTRKGETGESPFAAARAFAKVMCPNGRLPAEPVYGYNDWYCAYGDNTATNFLKDAAYVSECAKGLKVRPYVVMDDGWQQMSPPEIKRRTGRFESGRGPWRDSSAAFGMPMKDFTAAIAALGAKPGLWYRPFRAWDGTPDGQTVIGRKEYFDPSLPEMADRIRADIARFREWGMKLVKIDYLAYDVVQVWQGAMRETPLMRPPKWHRTDRTAAEVIRSLYAVMREAAGDEMVIIGCNAFNHFAAGLFELQRTGDDTSGSDWSRTELNGVNTLAMRMHQDGVFFRVDADCAGLVSRGSVEWAKNRQWIDLLGRSGTPVFISWFRDLADDEVRRTIALAFRRSAEGCESAEPVDWTATRTPKVWKFNGVEKTYDWKAHGADLDPLASLLPKPVKVERLAGSFDALRLKGANPPISSAIRPLEGTNGSDEAYVLEVTESGVSIAAPSVRGEHWARVTLRELEALSGGDIPCCRITDFPSLKWRGYMNDCGRNFLAVEGVKAILDEMERVKMNLFHWHLTDYHGWRLESKKYPQLQKPEAFRRQFGKYYTQDEFREIVRYAAERGITVMPELDVPGHSLALRVGLGVKSMAEKSVRKAVADLFEELCSLAPAEVMPFVHLGTDEARQRDEYCDDEYVSHWARTVNRCGRKAVVWAPGIRLDKDVDVIDMAWHDNEITNSANAFFDSARMYNGSWSPAQVSLKALFTKACRWNIDQRRNLGAITCTWHDDNVGEDTLKLFRDSMVMPSIAAFGDNYWSGREEDRPDLAGMGPFETPARGSREFAALVEFENRLALHRDYTLRGVKWPFPFVKRTALDWKLTKGKVGETVAEAVITGRADRVVGAWIDFTFCAGAYTRKNSGTPKVGQWDGVGSQIFFNGAEILPPVWENPGSKATYDGSADNEISCGNDLCEQPLGDLGVVCRPLVPIRLKAGENRVRIVLPKGADRRGALFLPAIGTTTNPREI